MPAEGVTQTSFLNDIHVAPKDAAQFTFHARQVKQTPRRIGRKSNENIHIAIRPEIITQNRAEQR